MRKKNPIAIMASVMFGLEVALILFLTLVTVSIKNNAELKKEFFSALERQGQTISQYGFSSENQVISMMILIMAGLSLVLIIIFILSLVGSIKNNEISLIVAVALSLFLVILFFFTQIIFLAVFQGVLTLFLFVAINQIRSSRLAMKQQFNNKKDNNRTVIDIDA